MMRAFVAVDAISSGAISKLQSEIISSTGWSTRDVKPVESSNFHFTIIFLGELNDRESERIREKLSTVQFEPFTISYSGVGAFPTPAAARIIWIGVNNDGAAKLTELAGKVVSALSQLGYRPDKPFSSHLTVFRVKARRPISLGGLEKKYEGVSFATDVVEKVSLKKSDLTPSGPVYSNIYTVEAKK